MGNSDSKVVNDDGPERTVLASVGTKESHYTNNTGFTTSSYDAEDEEYSFRERNEEEKKERDASSNRSSPSKPQLGTPAHRNDGNGSGSLPSQQQERRDDDYAAASSGHVITDDQVHVNLAMADLMAYLQVVANNSNNLPQTRRDDPDHHQGRTETSLTSEEYARKSAAFLPSDVRVIGGVFTRYGRVWDLPTSEEYNACDGALEPGRSYGGACSNSMLKVLYDAANDAADAAQTKAASDALFEDDDDDDEEEEEDESTLMMGKSYKSGFDIAAPNPSTISWLDLLRKMKAEIKEIQYAQVPKITTTRKLDLNKPFSLVPDNFDPQKGKKRSLLIGCNYSNIPGGELKASHDDVRSLKDYIVNVHGFPETNGLMTVLMDHEDYKPPTFLNIIEAFKALSEESQPGDAVFILFSGHGTRILAESNESSDQQASSSYDEVIVPSDYKVSGLIRDTLIFKTLLAPMRYGVTLTMMIDCCDNGMMMELPYSWTARNERRDQVAKLSMNEDFSFVRFLKVVRTLYESSTFTQIGRTVGSALGGNPNEMFDRSKGGGKASSKRKGGGSGNDGSKKDVARKVNTSIFDVIAEACHSPRKSCGNQIEEVDDRASLLEQVMNCTLSSHRGSGDAQEDYDGETHDDGYTDDEATWRTEEDTYKTRTEDDHSYDETDMGDSFETWEDEDEESLSRAPRRSRRGRRR